MDDLGDALVTFALILPLTVPLRDLSAEEEDKWAALFAQKGDILSHYIAGIIEGDESIKVPKENRSKKGKLLYPSITITFASKYLPLAELLASLLGDTINKTNGKWVGLTINVLSNLHFLAKILNGKFRTPKIEALHRLRMWLNHYGKFSPIHPLPLDTSPLVSNAWLSGIIETDSNFLISFLINSSLLKLKKKRGIAYSIHLTWRFIQRKEYHNESIFGSSYLNILEQIAFFLKVKKVNDITRKRNLYYTEKGWLVKITSIDSRERLINYLDQVPMLSSKYLDYINRKRGTAHNRVSSRSYRTIIGTKELIGLKESMNNKRTDFDWNHLNPYKL